MVQPEESVTLGEDWFDGAWAASEPVTEARAMVTTIKQEIGCFFFEPAIDTLRNSV
jgi:hypothetical protein